MISIVICSVNQDFLSQVKASIETSIGVPFELLVWKNRESNKGLCEVYNHMAAKAQFPYLCFLHEDVVFETMNWGNNLIALFNNNAKAGLVGVAGGKYKSLAYSGWYTGQPALDCYNITHRTNGADHKMTQPDLKKGRWHQVICLDGVFMACKKEVWSKIKFDVDLMKGFHFYDIDFSIRASQICEVYVSMEIEMIHITKGGDYGNAWVKEAIHFHRNRKELMPVSLSVPIPENIEQHVMVQWLDWLKVQNISFKNKFNWLSDQALFKKTALIYPMLKFLFYKPLGLKKIHQLFKQQP